ncbi:MAG: hypothetical protein DRI90_24525 [Deltaproteobacteria bacterium]|nr:MAG: hypothetical protein DRI90_24525 [Deltaproteobacteria bacterium]
MHVTHLKDGGSTLEGVEAALKAVASKARRRDVFVMFAAGHGGMAACEPRSHQERYYLLSYRATLRSRRKMCLEAISMQRLTGLLRPIHSNKKLLVLDTCQSGGAATGATLLAMRGAAEADAIKRLARAEGLAVLAASKPNQAAYESGPLGHGLFTYALLEGLQGSAAPRGDSTISVFSLVTYVDRRLPALARQYVGDDQQANYSIQGADFPLFSFVPTDPPLVSGATQGSSSKPAPAPDGSPTPPEAVDQAIDQYVRKEAALVLDCVGRDRAVVVATVQAGGTVAFAVQGLAAGSAQARCVERALTLSVGATGGVTRVPLRRE